MNGSRRGAEPPAVVVGLCAHGLAVARALAQAGVKVIALEANRHLPGFYTRYAEVRWVPDINGGGLIEALCGLDCPTPPVLMLTNDNMVRTVGQHWAALAGRFRLSWADCRAAILHLVDKSGLAEHCAAHGLPYPATRLLQDPAALETALAGLSFPLIVKPARPLSGFKVRLIPHRAALADLVQAHAASLPFLLQRWIPGDDRQLLFVALYLDRGRVLATVGGRKRASLPPALGQTTIAEPWHDAAAQALAERFFAPLSLSGPVSLEVKRDPAGQLWIVEPTLGRTDYWVDCCIANGVNLPVIEYRHQCGSHASTAPAVPTATPPVVWFDTENQPLAYLTYALGARDRPPGWRARFPYWGHRDRRPLGRAWRNLMRELMQKIARRLRRILGMTF